MHRKSLAIIGTVGVPAKYGGFETLAHQLVLRLARNYKLTVYNSAPHYRLKGERPKFWQGARIVYLPFKANGIQSIIYDIISIIHALFVAETLLLLGVSGGLFLPFVKWFTRRRVIVNIDGLEWRRAKWSGWISRFLLFSEAVAVRYADEVITDNEAIQKYVHERYNITSRLVEYGADHVSPVAVEPVLEGMFPFLFKPYAFKVCRIEPENNIHLVLEAFSRSSALPLVLVGNWDHSEYGRQLREKYSNCSNLYLLPPIYDQYLLNMIRSNCRVYVHGHSAGGTNPSLVEAMYLGLPILSYGVIYNRITTERKALYFETVEELTGALLQIGEADLDQLGQEMKQIAERRYTWSVISAKYSQAVDGLEKAPLPGFDFELPFPVQAAS